MKIEVGLVVIVTVVLEVWAGDVLGVILVVGREVLVVLFFFGALALFFKDAPCLRFFKNPVMKPFFLANNFCIALRGTAGRFAVSNPMDAFFFVAATFALICVSVYAVTFTDFLEAPCCLCRASRGFPGSSRK